MRIAIFTPFLYPFHVDMLLFLKNITDVELFTCGIYGNYPFGDLLMHAKRLNCYRIPGGERILGISGLIKFLHFKPNIVVLFGVESLAGITVYLISSLIKSKIIVIVEENYVTIPTNSILRVLRKLKEHIIKLIYKYAPILIAESEASRKYVLEVLRVKRSRPIVVHVHGVDARKYMKFYSVSKEQAKRLVIKTLKLPESIITKRWCTFIGEMAYSKGADVLIDAIEILAKTPGFSKNAVFLLPNDVRILRDKRELIEHYKRKLAQLVTNGLVVLYDFLKHKDMPLLYRASDVIVLPSRFLKNTSSDRSPNVALEALASGNILIASYVGGIPSIVDGAGLLIRPNDPQALATKLHEVLSNYDKYKYLEAKARERALNKLHIGLYINVLLKCLKNS